MRRRLRESQAEVATLRAAIRQVSDRKDAELGRIEAAAIRALDSVLGLRDGQVAELDARLRAALIQLQDRDQQLDDARRRLDRLQGSLAERDELLAAVRTQLADRDRRAELGAAVPSRRAGRA